ncbi:MAG: MBL fold hydrolase [Ignavibacteriae bacterium]|nr:MAG: MBL fold hydrolase [Ignavibacteriota bacterium]
MLKVKKLVFNPFQENTYLIWDDKTKESIIIDPGCSNNSEEKILLSTIEKKNLKIKYLLNTHCHIDHILGNHFIKEKYNVDFYAPELDLPLLDMAVEQAEMFRLEITPSPKPDKFITEDLTLAIGEHKMNFLFTPGHTQGEYSIIFYEEKICISGDVLFLEGIGRTDLWGGNYETLLNSIRTKLFTLEEDVKVFPGHGDSTTIGYEKEHNPFLKQ